MDPGRLATGITKFIAFMMFFNSGQVFAADKNAREKYGSSPHKVDGDCAVCHVYSSEKLKGWFVLGSTKRALKADPIELCVNCHGSGFGHAVGKKATVNHSNLPLGSGGEITCGITCHDMHVKAEDPKQNFYHLRMPFDSLCVSCHDS